jgi:LmbE family N-acetylglucosaminyl deacetylase
VLTLRPDNRRKLRVLCLGAHSDDIEIGCGGALLELQKRHGPLEISWVVFSAIGEREREARRSAERFTQGARVGQIVLEKFRDGYFPSQHSSLKERFEKLKSIGADIVFTHQREDLHQDHRIISELTWNTFRDHLVLEYEIVKYDGGLGSPNFFVPVSAANCRRKVRLLMSGFGTQRSKGWFTPETFMATLRIRGVESRSPSGYAEAFYARKVVI